MSRAIAVALVMAASTSSGVALAQGTSELEGLLDQPIVVTASKTAEAQSAAPATATVLTSDDLRRFGIHTIQEAIDFLSLGAATGSPPSGAEVGSRGVMVAGDHNDHVLLLINGHAVNEPLYGGANVDHTAGIPIELIDHIEVILGPGSVLYGTGAMLGVINVVTKKAHAFGGAHVIAEATPMTEGRVAVGMGYEFSLFGTSSELTGAAEYYRQQGPDLQFGVEQGRFDGLPPWGGTATRSNWSEVPSAMLRFTSGNLDVNVRGALVRYGLPSNNPALWFDQPQNRQYETWGSIDIAYRMPVSEILEVTARGYADSAERQDHNVSLPFFGCGAPRCDFSHLGAAHWAGAEVRASVDWFTTGAFVTLVGVDARVRSVAYKFDHLDPDTGAPIESTVNNFAHVDAPLGAYAQQTWQPAGWLALNAGLRLDDDPRFPAVLSPRLAATVKPWTNGAVKAIYSEAFRAPSWVETDSSSPIQFLAQNLRPEKVRMYELAVEQSAGSQRFRFGAFRYEWTDLVLLHGLTDAELMAAAASGALGDIPYMPGLFITQYRDVLAVTDYGFDMGYDGLALGGAFRYAANVTAAIARDADGQPVTAAPQLFGNARISYDFGGGLPTLALASRFQGRRVADRAFTGQFTPTPYASPVLELRATLSGAMPGVAGLSYRASATYAFQSYEPYVVGPQQGASAAQTYPDLMPNPTGRASGTIGLQYDF